MAEEFNTTTSHSDFIPTYTATQVLLAYTDHTQNGALAVAANVSSMLPNGGSTINVPRQPGVTVETITEGTIVEGQQVSASTNSLSISTHQGTRIPLTDILMAKSNQDLYSPMETQIAAAHAKSADAALCALYASAGEDVTGTTGANITEANVAEAKEKLDDAKAPMAGRWLIVNAQQLNALSKITRFSQADTIGSGSTIVTGRVGMIHGFNVYMSHNIVETTDGFAHCLAGVSAGPLESSLQIAYKPYAPLKSNTNTASIPEIGVRLAWQYNNAYFQDEITSQQNFGVATWRSEWLVDINVAN